MFSEEAYPDETCIVNTDKLMILYEVVPTFLTMSLLLFCKPTQSRERNLISSLGEFVKLKIFWGKIIE